MAAQQAVQTQLVANIASTYFQLLALDAQLKVVDSTLGNREKSVDVIKSLKDAGNVNEVGVKQTEAQLYTTQLIREDLKSNIVLLENTFNILLGEAPKQVNRSSFDTQSVTAVIKLGVPALALRKRSGCNRCRIQPDQLLRIDECREKPVLPDIDDQCDWRFSKYGYRPVVQR
ncbi:TolC family protein [Flavobacterium sp. 3HN19-14]|uniref:TolC family protein n=1 Tax=Flavobacterium sp. 3HN19-14 TaxID=3448133 RepID=UPI003EE2ABB4